MTDLEEQLRRYATAVAGPPREGGGADDLLEGGGRRARVPALAYGAAVIAFVLVIVAVLVLQSSDHQEGYVTSEGRLNDLQIELGVDTTTPSANEVLRGRLTVTNTGSQTISIQRICPSSIFLWSNWGGPQPSVSTPGQAPTPIDELTMQFSTYGSTRFTGPGCDQPIVELGPGDTLETEGTLDPTALGLRPGPAEVRMQLALGAVYAFDDMVSVHPIVVELPALPEGRLPLADALNRTLESPAVRSWAETHTDATFRTDVDTTPLGWQITIEKVARDGSASDALVAVVDDQGVRLAP